MALMRRLWLWWSMAAVVWMAGGWLVLLAVSHAQAVDALQAQGLAVGKSLAPSMSMAAGNEADTQARLQASLAAGGLVRLRWVSADGAPRFDALAAPAGSQAPAWFQQWQRLEGASVTVPLTAASAGQIELRVDPSASMDLLWSSAKRSAAGLLLVGMLVGLLWWVSSRRLGQELAVVVGHAQSVLERRLVMVSEPSVPELRLVTRATNNLVDRVKSVFDEQSAQLDVLRRQAHCDSLTAVSNRAHFMGRLKALLNAEDGSSGGALVLVRVCDLQAINRQLGRVQTDAMLRDLAQVIVESSHRSPLSEVGRLNGSDFALVLPDVGPLREPAVDVAARLRGLLRQRAEPVVAVVGAVRWWHGAPLSALLAAADHALARAEARGPFAVELDDTGDSLTLGEDAWRARLEDALTAGALHLVEYPVVDASGTVLHRECPLRITVAGYPEPLPAAQWLPMARRTQLIGRIDAVGVELALAAIRRDGMARSVNLSAGSLQESALLPTLRELLQKHADVAPGLWLELPESAVLRQAPLVRELVTLAHGFGTQVGLEHVGDQMTDAATLLEAGLDFVKLDVSVSEGLAGDTARAQHVGGIRRMLHSLGLKVYAEGVAHPEDATALWTAGVDGLTGPAVVAA